MTNTADGQFGSGQPALPEIVDSVEPGRQHRTGRARSFIGKFALAGMSMIGPVDYMTSDSKDAAIYGSLTETIELNDKAAERALEDGAFFVLGVGEVALVGAVIGRSKKARGAFDAYDEYRESREEDRGRIKDYIIKVIESPFSLLEKIGKKVEKKRDELENEDGVRLRRIKKIALDAGILNLMGTSTTQLQETMTGNPPKLGRNLYFGALFSGTWLAGAEAVRTVYREVPGVRAPMEVVGEAFNTMTSPTNPIGAATLSSVAAFLAYTGWRIESYRQKQEDNKNTEGEL